MTGDNFADQHTATRLASELAHARDLLEDATRVAVFSGAGMSAESGIPTFRDARTGLW